MEGPSWVEFLLSLKAGDKHLGGKIAGNESVNIARPFSRNLASSSHYRASLWLALQRRLSDCVH